MYTYRKITTYTKFIIFTALTLLVIVLPSFVDAQVTNANLQNKAPVVLDGQVLFEVGDFGIFSAQQRANKINQALITTVKLLIK